MCTRCHAIKPDDRPHLTVPSSDELELIQGDHRMALVSRVWKAVAAGVTSGLAAWGVAAQTGPVQGGQLAAIVLAALGVALTTYLAPKNVEA